MNKLIVSCFLIRVCLERLDVELHGGVSWGRYVSLNAPSRLEDLSGEV